MKLTAKQLNTVAAAVEAAFNKDAADDSYAARAEALGELDAVSTKPELAKQFAAKYGTTVTQKIAERGIKAGQVTWVFGSGDYDTDLVAGRCRKAFARMCSAAWEVEVKKAADTDAAAALLKALERVVKGRAKLAAADRRRFGKLAAGLGVSFV